MGGNVSRCKSNDRARETSRPRAKAGARAGLSKNNIYIFGTPIPLSSGLFRRPGRIIGFRNETGDGENLKFGRIFSEISITPIAATHSYWDFVCKIGAYRVSFAPPYASNFIGPVNTTSDWQRILELSCVRISDTPDRHASLGIGFHNPRFHSPPIQCFTQYAELQSPVKNGPDLKAAPQYCRAHLHFTERARKYK